MICAAVSSMNGHPEHADLKLGINIYLVIFPVNGGGVSGECGLHLELKISQEHVTATARAAKQLFFLYMRYIQALAQK